MQEYLGKEPFEESHWNEVQTFQCGDEPSEKEVSDWLKAPADQEESALAAIRNLTRPSQVYLYRLRDRSLVGFSSIGKSRWRWTRNKDPYVPVTVVTWIAVSEQYQGKPQGVPEDRFSYRIMEDVLSEALKDQTTHPILGLMVDRENQRAIRFYKQFNFTEELSPYIDRNNGREYNRMALVLNSESLIEIVENAKKK